MKIAVKPAYKRIMLNIFFSPDKITSPSNQDEDTDVIMAFCDQVNKHLEGPQIAIRLLAYKVQSPQERECLHALSVCFLKS